MAAHRIATTSAKIFLRSFKLCHLYINNNKDSIDKNAADTAQCKRTWSPRGGSRGVSRVSGHLPFCLECPFLKVINFQNVVYFHYAYPQKSSILTDNFVPFMFNFAIFFISEMGGETLKQLTIQVSCVRPPGPALLRRFKQKFKLACLVGT